MLFRSIDIALYAWVKHQMHKLDGVKTNTNTAPGRSLVWHCFHMSNDHARVSFLVDLCVFLAALLRRLHRLFRTSSRSHGRSYELSCRSHRYMARQVPLQVEQVLDDPFLAQHSGTLSFVLHCIICASYHTRYLCAMLPRCFWIMFLLLSFLSVLIVFVYK